MTIFILGAGFNADAHVEAGPLFAEHLYRGQYQIDCSYPLVADTIRLCFGLDRLPEGRSVEDLFLDALERRDYRPMQKLAERLRYADYRIASALASGGRENIYAQFFHNFLKSSFLTFNYDSLPETFLFRLGHWYPRDGYGVAVVADLPPGAEGLADKKSSALVLHLHGSLCIRTSEYEARRELGQATAWLTLRDKPRYAFDPSSIYANFAPFDRDVGADDVEDRIIAPVPDKSHGLKGAFINDTYTRAEALVRDSDIMVAIGYSFNPHDRASYERLLLALGESNGRRLLVVSPDAGTIARAIRPVFPRLHIEPMEARFKQWVSESFPGLQ